jgi:hypothetical protein
MNTVNFSLLAFALSLGVGSLFLAAAQELEKKKIPKLEKDEWRYEIESTVAAGKNSAVYRVRIWAAAEQDFLVNLGNDISFGRRLKMAASGQFSVELVVIAELTPSAEAGNKKLKFSRRFQFAGEKEPGGLYEDDVAADSDVQKLMSVKEGSGILKIGQKYSLGDIYGQSVSLELTESKDRLKITPLPDVPANPKAEKRFHKRLAELAKETSDAPLDLLTELLVENRRFVRDEQWQQTVDIVTAIARKTLRDKKSSWKFPAPDLDVRKLKENVVRAISVDSLRQRRVIADRVTALRGIGLSVVIVAQAFDSPVNVESIVLVNDTINLRSKSGTEPAGEFDESFLFCDGDLSCREGAPITIARGRVHLQKKHDDDIVIENARKSSIVKLFTLERVGLNVVQNGKELRVESVLAGSRSEKSGFKRGDIIQIEKKTTDLVSDLERTVRHAYVLETNLEMTIVRDGRQQKLVLTFGD